MKNALAHYHSMNGFLPEKIVLYRDGVSDGGIETFKQNEITAMRNAFNLEGTNISFPELKGGPYQPEFTCVIVSKRINTRMYAKKGKLLDNPMPGTILDTGVTKGFYKDFYLVSQYVRQGTVTPTHFIVLDGDEKGKGMPADVVQKLSYKLTAMDKFRLIIERFFIRKFKFFEFY